MQKVKCYREMHVMNVAWRKMYITQALTQRIADVIKCKDIIRYERMPRANYMKME